MRQTAEDFEQTADEMRWAADTEPNRARRRRFKEREHRNQVIADRLRRENRYATDEERAWTEDWIRRNSKEQ
jgi:hypothetical protein